MKPSTEHEVNGAIRLSSSMPRTDEEVEEEKLMSMQFNDIIMYTDLCENKSIHNMLRLVFYNW